MINFTLIPALLWILSWISASAAEFHTVEVQPAEDVTLLCSNFSTVPIHIHWFKLGNRPNISCISSMFSSDSNVSFCNGFQDGRFNMTSNITNLFLKIKQVDLSDSGLYFCGFNSDGKSVVIVSATYLKVEEVADEKTKLTTVIPGALIIVFVIVIIGLVVKIRKLQTAHKDGQNPQLSENVGSNAPTYAAVRFHPKAKSSRKPPSETQLEEPNVVYAATR